MYFGNLLSSERFDARQAVTNELMENKENGKTQPNAAALSVQDLPLPSSSPWMEKEIKRVRDIERPGTLNHTLDTFLCFCPTQSSRTCVTRARHHA